MTTCGRAEHPSRCGAIRMAVETSRSAARARGRLRRRRRRRCDSRPPSCRWSAAPRQSPSGRRSLLLFPLAALAPRFRVAVGRNHSFHTGPAFIVAGALVLPPRAASSRSSSPSTCRWCRTTDPLVHPEVQPLELHAQRASPPGSSSTRSAPGRRRLASPSPACSPRPSSSPSTTCCSRSCCGSAAGTRSARAASSPRPGSESSSCIAALGVAVGAFADSIPGSCRP